MHIYIICFACLGPSSKNPLAFKWYNAQEEILGKKMKVGLLFSFCLFFVHLLFWENTYEGIKKYTAWPAGLDEI